MLTAVAVMRIVFLRLRFWAMIIRQLALHVDIPMAAVVFDWGSRHPGRRSERPLLLPRWILVAMRLAASMDRFFLACLDSSHARTFWVAKL